jgi:hypothetical protein
MNEMRKLNDQERLVLKSCCEEPCNIELIKQNTRFDIEFIKPILKELLNLKLVRVSEFGIWSSTKEGDEVYYTK